MGEEGDRTLVTVAAAAAAVRVMNCIVTEVIWHTNVVAVAVLVMNYTVM
jgi:hypothetical protein